MSGTEPRTLFDKIWDAHIVAKLAGGMDLIHVDRHLLHDLSGGGGLAQIERLGHRVRNPELTFATPDHGVLTDPGRREDQSERSARLVRGLRTRAQKWGIRLFDFDDPEQGIVHVVGPELGLSLPGTVIVCGDSHTSTHGGIGAVAWGIGSSELVHVLATQTTIQRRPKRMRVTFEGRAAPEVTPKDMALYLIGHVTAAGGAGHAVEYAGPAIRALDIEGRLTIANLSIELGARIGLVAPDDRTFDYLAGRPFAPEGGGFEEAVAHWRRLPTDEGARFDREVTIDAGAIAPQITWGTSPEHTVGIDGRVPDPGAVPQNRKAYEDALAYMGLEPGTPMEGIPIDRVFIGSCTNARLSDLQAAARVVRGRKVAAGLTAWVVPGSRTVKREAEAEGLDRIFREAGFDWREPGCSTCSATNGEVVPPGARCISTSNRNFVGRQGPGARTHLASPAMAAAAAIAGSITDVRRIGG